MGVDPESGRAVFNSAAALRDELDEGFDFDTPRTGRRREPGCDRGSSAHTTRSKQPRSGTGTRSS